MTTVRTNNVEFLTELMETSTTGPLIQAFILEAVRIYADMTVKAGPWPVATATFINQEDWKRAAQECLDAIEARHTI